VTDLADRLGRLAPRVDTDGDLRRLRERSSVLDRRRRVVVGVVALAAIIGGAVGAVALARIEDRREATVAPGTRSGWVELADPPFSGSFVPAGAVWTGHEAIWWGGPDQGDTPWGAAYDPGSDTWRTIAASPLRMRTDAAVVWTGEEMIVWGGHPAPFEPYEEIGAAYDPQTDTWRTIAAAPIQSRGDVAAVWTGSEMIVAGGERVDGPPVCAADAPCPALPSARVMRDGAAYDPRSDTWRTISSAPGPLVDRVAVTWTGDEMWFFGGLVGWAYEPDADHWSSIGFERAAGGHDLRLASFNAAGGVAFAIDQSLNGPRFEPQEDPFFVYRRDLNEWIPIPSRLPRANVFPRCESTAAAVGALVAVVGCTRALFDPRSGGWRPIPAHSSDPTLEEAVRLLATARFALGTDDMLLLLDAGNLLHPRLPRFLGYQFDFDTQN
jgi:hypothetical protein